MLFDMSASSNSRKIMQLNPEYPKDVTMKSTDGTAVFKAEIAKNGRPDEYTYQWYVNGAAVAEANHKEYERNISGDKGQYTVWCEVTNKAGTVRTRTATLTVNRLPVLDENYPADASTTIGNACEFKVTVSEEGYPDSYTYQWYKNGKAVSGETKSSYSLYPSLGATTVYCKVTNGAGTVDSRTATIQTSARMLYNYGNHYSELTGGWVAAKPGSNSSDSYGKGFYDADTFMSITGREEHYGCGCGTAKMLDLSRYTKLCARVKSSTAAYMHVSSQLQHFSEYSKASYYLPADADISLDISNIDSGYIAFEAYPGSAWIYAVWLE